MVLRTAQQNRPGFVTARRALEWAILVAGFVAVRFVGRPASLWGWLLLLLAALLVAAPVVLAARREYLREREAASAADLAVSYRSRLTVTLGDALIPVADLLGRVIVAHGAERVRLRAQLRQGVVDAAAALCGPERTRAALFLLTGAEFRPVAWGGRADAPSIPFRGRSGLDGAGYLQVLLAAHDRLLVSDVRERRSPIRAEPDAGFRALIVVAIYAGDQDLGVLMVDTPDPQSLDDSDLDLAVTLGQLLGAGLGAGSVRLAPDEPGDAQRH